MWGSMAFRRVIRESYSPLSAFPPWGFFMSVAFGLLTFKICSEHLFYTSRVTSQEGFGTDNIK